MKETAETGEFYLIKDKELAKEIRKEVIQKFKVQKTELFFII